LKNSVPNCLRDHQITQSQDTDGKAHHIAPSPKRALSQ